MQADHELRGSVVSKVLDSMDVHGRLTLDDFLAIADVRARLPPSLVTRPCVIEPTHTHVPAGPCKFECQAPKTLGTSSNVTETRAYTYASSLVRLALEIFCCNSSFTRPALIAGLQRCYVLHSAGPLAIGVHICIPGQLHCSLVKLP